MASIPKWLEVRSPFFRPIWRRVLVLGLTVIWTGFEFVRGAPLWGVFFAAAALYLAWAFFWSFEDGPDQ